MIEEIYTDQAPTPSGPYSQAVKSGNRVYVSGQRPVDPNTGKIPDSLFEQTNQVFKNVETILAAAGASMSNIVKVGVYLADLKYFQEFNQIYAQYFTKPYPVRTTIGCELRDILVEVDVIAEL